MPTHLTPASPTSSVLTGSHQGVDYQLRLADPDISAVVVSELHLPGQPGGFRKFRCTDDLSDPAAELERQQHLIHQAIEAMHEDLLSLRGGWPIEIDTGPDDLASSIGLCTLKAADASGIAYATQWWGGAELWTRVRRDARQHNAEMRQVSVTEIIGTCFDDMLAGWSSAWLDEWPKPHLPFTDGAETYHGPEESTPEYHLLGAVSADPDTVWRARACMITACNESGLSRGGKSRWSAAHTLDDLLGDIEAAVPGIRAKYEIAGNTHDALFEKTMARHFRIPQDLQDARATWVQASLAMQN